MFDFSSILASHVLASQMAKQQADQRSCRPSGDWLDQPEWHGFLPLVHVLARRRSAKRARALRQTTDTTKASSSSACDFTAKPACS
jgi:hypothetical protein